MDELHEAATPGEWIAHRSEIIRRDNDTEPWFIVGDLSSDDSPGTMNAEFVVALRNVYPAMAAELRKLRAENASMVDLIDDLVSQSCSVRDNLSNTVVDSRAISVYEEAIELLVDKSRLELLPAGRIIARRALEVVE